TSYIVIPLVSYTRRTAPSSLVLMLYTKSLNWNLPVMVFFTFIQRALKFEEIPHNTRSPIGGRIRDAPKARCGPREFHCNLSRSHRHFLYVDHTALFLFPAVYVLHEEPLLRRYFFR